MSTISTISTMSTNLRANSINNIKELLKSNDFDNLKNKYDLHLKFNNDKSLAIFHYGKHIGSNNTLIDSCRGLIIETFPPYKIVSRGFDRFNEKQENLNTIVNVKKITSKEDGDRKSVV